MSVQMVLLPLFVLVILTFAIGIVMAVRRQDAFRSGQTRWQDIAVTHEGWPRQCMQASHAFSNQFELPVLFYVLTILALITKQADLIFVILAWIFVIMRVLQAGVHLTSNHVPTRGAFYAVGAVVLIIMWGVYIVRILTLPWP
ncbi:MAPEG family protein [Pseudorhodoplanes sinuspersici]|uniref:Uncharacterized protein n=1 Tax=Pseudorhodoplanes sinuspersici TaxID=1235591 RepID=A0A1W6ZY15_9HYPH|nr:MAPEG family protein [Pseudorhodoplanes sinuspersici]ARQ02206.1 hypothetical protein CAK95_26245 [Pseudorhodoplanes sinuspersici]RKE74026.1 hypothetical protein DFP91_1925 [Pseudorhodoplanes sinuspersici]